MTSSNGRTTRGDIASLLVLGCDWAGLEWTRPEHVHVATVAEQATFVAVAEMALFAVVAEQALFVAVAEMALDT